MLNVTAKLDELGFDERWRSITYLDCFQQFLIVTEQNDVIIIIVTSLWSWLLLVLRDFVLQYYLAKFGSNWTTNKGERRGAQWMPPSLNRVICYTSSGTLIKKNQEIHCCHGSPISNTGKRFCKMQQNWVRVVLFVMNNKEKLVWDCIYVILAILTQWKYEIMSYLNNCLFRKSNPRVGEGRGAL